VSNTPPSGTWVLRAGKVVIRPAAGFRVDGAIDTGCGKPKRAVPRVTMLDPSTRFSTGTRIGDGTGGAVRAAASAGDSMRDPATNARAAAAATASNTADNIWMRREAICYRLRRLT
jgi:hypothetical protein